jgi:hypothetical protein
MNKYHKIKTVWQRDPSNSHKTLLENKWSKPEFKYMAKLDWEWTEKVDGQNIRVIWDPASEPAQVDVRGKTDRADLHHDLVANIREMFPPTLMRDKFGDRQCTLYGEGYGAGIARGGGLYRQDKSFILFDVLMEHKGKELPYFAWLARQNVYDIADSLRCLRVPTVHIGSLYDALTECANGFLSSVATEGYVDAEGLVCRPLVEMTNTFGERVITKIKCKDFS